MKQQTFELLPKLILDKKRSRIKQCPCGKSNKDGKFVPYIGYDDKGFCHGCGETFLPELKSNDESRKYPNQAKKHNILYTTKTDKSDTLKKEVNTIQVTSFKGSLKHHSQNNLVKYLLNLFGSEITMQVISKYFIGTSKYWNGATVFWQIDVSGKIKAGKIMLYNALTGKRIKEPYDHINWVHNVLELPEFDLQQCFFGEHLLKGNDMPAAIFESEKAAIIASIYLPKFICIAAGGKDGLKEEKCKVLKGRKVVLYPDLNAFELWTNKAKEFSHITRFEISDLLERKASAEEKSKGLDLADYLIKFPVKEFEPESIRLFVKDIHPGVAETHLGKEFNGLNTVYFVKKDGTGYDMLFDENGMLIQPGEQVETIKKFEAFYKRKLQPAIFEDSKCWVHIEKKIITNNN